MPTDQVIKTGSPMREVLEYYANDVNKSNILEKLKLESGQYFVVSSHREENIDSTRNLVVDGNT